MDSFEHVRVRSEDGVTVATLVNPPRNFMNARMVEEMNTLADRLTEDESSRALVITGGADGIFITHYDVSELTQLSDAIRRMDRAPETPQLHPLNRLSMKLRALPQPVIAAINGTAMGGGCELALACDFRIMARGYQIGLPEVRVGILPGAGGTQRMARLLGQAKALELMLLGDTVEAEDAVRIGLVHRAVAPERVVGEALSLAQALASRPRTSIAEIKRCVYEGIELPMERALLFEQAAFNRTMRSDDASRLMRAYVQGERRLDEM